MAQIDSEWAQLLSKSQPRDFSNAIVFDVLSRLPIKSILRFKSVCKKWNALLGSSRFIETHMKRLNDMYDGRYLLRWYNFGNEEAGTGHGDVFCLRSEENLEEECELFFERDPSHFYFVVESAGGIVCLKELGYSRSGLFDLYILLWNPATRELRILPKFPGQTFGTLGFITCFGFGFDPKHNDYKVVGIQRSKDSVDVNVYSLRSDSWTKVVEKDSYKCLHSTAINSNDRMHWFGSSMFCDLIVSFDVIEEKVVEIDVPEFDPDDDTLLCESPASLGKSLILCDFIYDGGCQTWFMKEYGDSKSWTKLYYFHPHPIYGCLSPQFFLDNGMIIMHGHQYVLLHDPKDQVYKILNFDFSTTIVRYQQSLLSVKGG